MADTAAASAATASKPKVTLHWLNLSRSQRIVWLLEECKGLDWDIKTYKRLPTQLAPPELKKIHPLGKSPVITVESEHSKEPLVLAETGFLTEYLVQYFAPHLAPTQYKPGLENQVGGETEEWLRYRFYMHYNEGSLMTVMILALFMDQIKARSPFFAKPITGEIVRRVYQQFLTAEFATQFSFLDGQLASSPGGGKYLCGTKLTAADILMSFPLLAGKEKIDLQKYPKLAAYVEVLENEEVYKKSIKRIEEETGEKFEVASSR